METPEQPTLPDDDRTQPLVPISDLAGSDTQKRPSSRRSRRKLFIGAGVGVATTAVAGVALAQIVQHSGTTQSSSTSIQGSNVQIGHLLRRAGFGVTPDELSTY